MNLLGSSVLDLVSTNEEGMMNNMEHPYLVLLPAPVPASTINFCS